MPTEPACPNQTKRDLAEIGPHWGAPGGRLDCQLTVHKAKVAIGRTQATCFYHLGQPGKCARAPQKYRSRACQRAQHSFLVCAWWPLWPPAQKKKKPWFQRQNRSQPNLRIPANTSDLILKTAPMAQCHGVICKKNHQNRLSADYRPMLKPTAVPLIQDRRPC